MNNSFYVLSREWKKQEKCKRREALNNQKIRKLEEERKKTLCIACKSAQMQIFEGEWKGWCHFCKEIELDMDEWQMQCWKESEKPEAQQNMAVYRGQVVKKCIVCHEHYATVTEGVFRGYCASCKSTDEYDMQLC